MNYYVTPDQEKWLLANGLKPHCPEKGIPLLEAAQWIWMNRKVSVDYTIYNEVETQVWAVTDDVDDITSYKCIAEDRFNTIPDALSWAIDQAINHVNNQNNEQRN